MHQTTSRNNEIEAVLWHCFLNNISAELRSNLWHSLQNHAKTLFSDRRSVPVPFPFYLYRSVPVRVRFLVLVRPFPVFVPFVDRSRSGFVFSVRFLKHRSGPVLPIPAV